MHISLTDRLDEYVREKVASGLYNNASEVIREALRRQIAEDESREAKRARLLEEIEIGWAQADRGEAVPFDLGDIRSRIEAADVAGDA